MNDSKAFEPSHDDTSEPLTRHSGELPSSSRRHDLDALRGAAMLLGIVLHAALFYIPGEWTARYPGQASGVYTLILFAIHGFRMPVFFLLSGFFTAMLWRRRGLGALGTHRLRRVGLPLLIGTFTIVPLTIWLLVPDDFEPIWIPFIWLGEVGFSHLWFLWHLLWLTGGFMILAKMGVTFRHRWLWWLAVPLTLLPQALMVEEVFGPDTSEQLIVNPVVLGYYALFFLFGAAMHESKMAIRRSWAFGLLPALLIVFPVSLSILYDVQGEWTRLAGAALQTTYAWLMCFGFMGLFQLIAKRERGWVRYLSDASYWLYLWHLALIIAGHKAMFALPLIVHVKFLLLVAVVPAILLPTYAFGVRYTPIGALLNGKRVRRKRPAAT